MDSINVRTFQVRDGDAVLELYKDTTTYGGTFDDERDNLQRLQKMADDILVAEKDGVVVGCVQLMNNTHTALLWRFAVKYDDLVVAEALYNEAAERFKQRGHSQVIVFAPASGDFDGRYEQLGFQKGNDYSAYWREM